VIGSGRLIHAHSCSQLTSAYVGNADTLLSVVSASYFALGSTASVPGFGFFTQFAGDSHSLNLRRIEWQVADLSNLFFEGT
jgi:hypothetical protein